MKIKTLHDFRRAALRGAIRGLASQGYERAYHNGCVWRDGTGRCCGVGWLIPNAKLPPGSDAVVSGNAVQALHDRRLADPLQAWTDDHKGQAENTLLGIQNVHDLSPTPSQMRLALRKLCAKWRVPWPEDVPEEAT